MILMFGIILLMNCLAVLIDITVISWFVAIFMDAPGNFWPIGVILSLLLTGFHIYTIIESIKLMKHHAQRSN